MSTNDPMQSGAIMGAGMEPAVGQGMDPNEPDLHTLDPETQRARMGLAQSRTGIGQPPGEGMPSADEIARREEALKRGENP